MDISELKPEILRSMPLFEHITDKDAYKILTCPDTEIVSIPAKQTIFNEEEIGNCMYIVIDGVVEIFLRTGVGNSNITVATIKKGMYFGEQSILPGSDGKRNAGARTLRNSTLLKITKNHLTRAVTKQYRPAVYKKSKTKLNEDEKLDVLSVFEEMRIFRNIGIYDLNCYKEWSQIVKIDPGEIIFRENETAECFYVVITGIVEIFTIDEDGRLTIFAKLTRGRYFGEQAILPGIDGNRNAYARADDDVILAKVPKSYFHSMLRQDQELEQELRSIGLQQSTKNIKKTLLS